MRFLTENYRNSVTIFDRTCCAHCVAKQLSRLLPLHLHVAQECLRRVVALFLALFVPLKAPLLSRQKSLVQSLLLSVITATTMSGCAFLFGQRAAAPAVQTTVPVAPIAPTALTDAAKDMLAAAEQSVTTAEVTRTLWSSARQKLLAAREAAKVFDSERTILLSREVIQLCVRSAEQAKSAPVTW